jgi:hypothetical protein
MPQTALRRLKALVLTAVLLFGGSGASALDLALYHFGSAESHAATHRISGSDAPRSHGDTCVLLDWSARGPYVVALAPQSPQAVAPQADSSTPVRADRPRPVDLTASPRPRAPPVPLV